MKLIYICSCDISVYDSQVLSLLEYHIEKGIDVTLIQGFRNEKEKDSLEHKLSVHKHIDVVWMKWSSINPFRETSKIDTLYKAICSINNSKKAVFHLRDIYSTYVLMKVFRKFKYSCPTLLDIRGIGLEEMKYTFRTTDYLHKIQFFYLIGYYKYVYNYLFGGKHHPITITSVSPLINEYIKNNYNRCPFKLYFHPNIAGSQFIYSEIERIRVRNSLGIKKEEIVAICSTNGNAVWQKDYLVVDKLVSMGFRVINLSSVQLNKKGCITTKVNFADMPAYLSAADIAVLWRDNTFVNNSASPSKFSEFAAMGLYVIHNNSVKVAQEYITNNKGGCLVNDISEIETSIDVETVLNDRSNRIDSGISAFGIANVGDSYIKLYESIRLQ